MRISFYRFHVKKMKLYRIKAVMIQEYFMMGRSMETLVDIFVYPIMNIIVFGFISKFLLGFTNQSSFLSLIIAMLFWQLFSTSQYSVSIPTLWNIWSHNLTNLFASPITLSEYFISHAVTALVKSLIVFIIGSGIAYLQFGFSVLQLPLFFLFIMMINLYISGISIGLVLIGLIFAKGTRIQALTWGVVSIIQPLAAVFYPLSIIPEPLQSVSRILPLTYMFEALRHTIFDGTILPSTQHLLITGSLITVLYFFLSLIIFKHFVNVSRQTGQFAKNDQ